MNIRIYQINHERDEKNVMFMRHELLEKFQGSSKVDSSIYDKVYDNDFDCKSLEDIFRAFNYNRPPEYTGRSLSVSDVVQICDENSSVEQGFYFCDSFGFKKVDFEPEKTQEKDVKKIKVVMVEPGKEARIVKLEDDLRAKQHAVQGDIDAMFPFEDQVAIVNNRNGKLEKLPLNRAIYMDGEMVDIIAGTFFICATSTESENFEGLTDEQAVKYLEMFKEPERFYRGWDGKIKAEKIKPALKDTITEARNSVLSQTSVVEDKNVERDM